MAFVNSVTKQAGAQKKTPNIQNISDIFQKIPPQATKIECGVLGAILVEQGAFEKAHVFLKDLVQIFYEPRHQQIYETMLALYTRKQAIDLLTVVQALKDKEVLEEVGGEIYLVGLTQMVLTANNVESHAIILLTKYIQRELIRVGAAMIQRSYEQHPEAEPLIDAAEQELFEVSNLFLRKHYESLSDVLFPTMERIDDLRKEAKTVTGVYTGFADLDEATGGWQQGELIILAARPSVGKTALAMNFALGASAHQKAQAPVGIFSLEMSMDRLAERFLSMRSEIPLEKIVRGTLSDKEMELLSLNGMQALAPLHIFIDDTSGLNLFELRAKCRRMVSQDKVRLILIDYLQLLSAGEKTFGSRELEVSKISRELKGLAKELEVPIIALSQLSRDVEKRGDAKIPQLSDLRESGAIEQDADLVIFLYRPEYHGILQNENGESTKGLTQLKIAKNRNGKLATVDLHFKGDIQKFVRWSGAEMSSLTPYSYTPSELPPVPEMPDSPLPFSDNPPF